MPRTVYERITVHHHRPIRLLLGLLLMIQAAAAMADRPVTVINWNVLMQFAHGEQVDAGADWIRQQAPDVVGLQELNGLSESELGELAARWGHDHVAILKRWGYPVGITSSQPIEVIARRHWRYHHGHIQAKTHGINFFVVHFWPKKEEEAEDIIGFAGKLTEEGEPVLVMGDFNSHSARDKTFLDTRTGLKRVYFDVVEWFERNGFVDLVNRHSPEQKHTYPSRHFHVDETFLPEWESKKERIDFALANEVLARQSTGARVVVSRDIDRISDHYPLLLTFTME